MCGKMAGRALRSLMMTKRHLLNTLLVSAKAYRFCSFVFVYAALGAAACMAAVVCANAEPSSPFVTRARASKRKLRKWQSHEESVVVEPRLCISGGFLKAPVCLDAVQIEGVDMVPIRSSSSWLSQLLAGFCRTPLGDLLKTVQADFRVALDEQGHGAEKQDAENAAGKRAGLFSDDDDDNKKDASSDEAATRPRKKVKKTKQPLNVPREVNLRNRTVTIAWKRGSLHVLAESSCMGQFLDILRSYSKTEVEEKTPQKDKPAEEEGGIKGMVVWLFHSRTWSIVYQDENGKRHQFTKGLKVPERAWDGSVLTAEDYKKARDDVRLRAIRKWNELDRSGRERLSETDGMSEAAQSAPLS